MRYRLHLQYRLPICAPSRTRDMSTLEEDEIFYIPLYTTNPYQSRWLKSMDFFFIRDLQSRLLFVPRGLFLSLREAPLKGVGYRAAHVVRTWLHLGQALVPRL